MKFKNLKINRKAVSKLAACVLVGSLALTLSGCSVNSKNDNILKGSILEGSTVVTFEDGSKDIAIKGADKHCFHDDCVHYYSIISGEYFSSKSCNAESIDGIALRKYTIINEESIGKFLTVDELSNAIEGNLENSDIVNIITRVVDVNDDVKNLTK